MSPQKPVSPFDQGNTGTGPSLDAARNAGTPDEVRSPGDSTTVHDAADVNAAAGGAVRYDKVQATAILERIAGEAGVQREKARAVILSGDYSTEAEGQQVKMYLRSAHIDAGALRTALSSERRDG